MSGTFKLPSAFGMRIYARIDSPNSRRLFPIIQSWPKLDLEMAFAGSEDVMGVIETLVKNVWNKVIPGSVDTGASFLRMTYYDAMRKVSLSWFTLIIVWKWQAWSTIWYGCILALGSIWRKFKEIPQRFSASKLYAFVVKQGNAMSSKVRRGICDEAKATSDEYIASAVFHNYPDTKRWIDAVNKLNRDITDGDYHDLNAALGIEPNDAIFVSERPETFTVRNR